VSAARSPLDRPPWSSPPELERVQAEYYLSAVSPGAVSPAAVSGGAGQTRFLRGLGAVEGVVVGLDEPVGGLAIEYFDTLDGTVDRTARVRVRLRL
jgi:hypothetical protein